MEYEKFGDRCVVRLDKGEEVVSALKDFCEDNNIQLGLIMGLGSASEVELALFDTDKKEFHSRKLKGVFEIALLNGNISQMEGKVYLHIHAVIGDEEFNSYAGHLKSAVISGTGEVIIYGWEGRLEREFSGEIGLNLYKFHHCRNRGTETQKDKA